MKKEVLFRTCIFGGYNKKDVLHYVHCLEEALEHGKSAGSELSIGREDAPGYAETDDEKADTWEDRIIFDGQMEAPPRQQKNREHSPAPSSGGQDYLKEEVQQLRKLLEEKEQEIEESRDELRELKQECEKFQKERLEAESIVAKAEEKVRRMEMMEADGQMETRRAIALVASHLEENRAGLDKSKLCLEQQLKSIDFVKSQLEDVLNHVGFMAGQVQVLGRKEEPHRNVGSSITIERENDDKFIAGGKLT